MKKNEQMQTMKKCKRKRRREHIFEIILNNTKIWKFLNHSVHEQRRKFKISKQKEKSIHSLYSNDFLMEFYEG